MATECYAMVRGSSLRVTGLKPCGTIPEPGQYGVSKSVVKVTINEIVDSGSNELIRNDEEEGRLRFTTPDTTIRYTADIDFLRCDPGILHLVTGMPLVYDHGSTEIVGFGEGGFGEGPLGGGGEEIDPETAVVVGFDFNTRIPATAFALEVWTKLAGQNCVDGERQYGYSLFPYLKGGYLTGFQFGNGAVTFTLKGAQTRRSAKWGVGPHDLTGPYERLATPVSRNLHMRTFITTAPPPEQEDGILEFSDVIDGGSASVTSSDILDGEFVITSSDIVEGGSAA